MSLAPFYLIALAFVGIADTLYLAYNEFLDTAPSCLLVGCDVVLTHPLSEFLDIPLSYWGLVFYVYALLFVALLALEPRSKVLTWAVVLYTGVGFLASAGFVYIQAVIIGAFCQYCVLSAIIATGLFVLALWHLRSSHLFK